MPITLNAPAKINLFLEVLSRRDDGYHDLETVMQTVDLCDELTLEDAPETSLAVRFDNPEGYDHFPVGDDNIILKEYFIDFYFTHNNIF